MSTPITVPSLHLQKFFAWVVTLLCLLAAVAYISEPIDPGAMQTEAVSAQDGKTPAATAPPTTAPAASPQAHERLAFKVCLLLAAGAGAAWFAFAFTGNPVLRRDEQVKFAYFFVIASFAVLTVPPFVKSQSIGNEPIGIISGCVENTEAVELRCRPEPAPAQDGAQAGQQNDRGGEAAPVPPEQTGTARNQWLVNIGGALAPQAPGSCTGNPSECKIGSPKNRAVVSGGIVVPLPFVIIALFGGAISLSRRVPEIQKRSEPDYVGSEAEPALGMPQAREFLAFQILQFVSAPLIAITAHQVIAPQSQASAVALAFLAGFGSETILLMIRGIANGLQPQSVTRPPNRAGTGKDAAAEPAPGGTVGTVGTIGSANGQAPLSASLRLSIDIDSLDAGSLEFSVDGTPTALSAEGLAELSLEIGREHRLEASARRNGQAVHGALALTPTVDDEGRPVEIKLE
jgi:hypothetical protein